MTMTSISMNEWSFLKKFWPKIEDDTVVDPLWIVAGTQKEYEDFDPETKLGLKTDGTYWQCSGNTWIPFKD